MRLLLAACFVFASILGLVWFTGSRYPDDQWPWWSGPATCGAFLGSVVVALILFNRRGYRPSAPWKTIEEKIDELRQQGLLISEAFTARRTFQVEEYEDEGSHYFVELSDGRTLYLTGQYLYDFAPIEDDPELNQPRRFPCTAFTILRHKEAGYVVDILCSGEVLEPELIAPPFTREDRRRDILEDGTVISDTTYDKIKAQRLRTPNTNA